jgi:hypothetical protein
MEHLLSGHHLQLAVKAQPPILIPPTTMNLFLLGMYLHPYHTNFLKWTCPPFNLDKTIHDFKG